LAATKDFSVSAALKLAGAHFLPGQAISEPQPAPVVFSRPFFSGPSQKGLSGRVLESPENRFFRPPRKRVPFFWGVRKNGLPPGPPGKALFWTPPERGRSGPFGPFPPPFTGGKPAFLGGPFGPDRALFWGVLRKGPVL
jgi:hypothetical protein